MEKLQNIKDFLDALIISEELTNTKTYNVRQAIKNIFIDKYIKDTIINNYRINFLLIRYENNSYMIYSSKNNSIKYKKFYESKSEEDIINKLIEIL